MPFDFYMNHSSAEEHIIPFISKSSLTLVDVVLGADVIGKRKFLYPFKMAAINRKKASCINSSISFCKVDGIIVCA